jgi:hypothetical protein
MGKIIWRGLLANGKYAACVAGWTRREAETKAKILNDTIDAWGENRVIAPPSRCVDVVEWECPERG